MELVRSRNIQRSHARACACALSTQLATHAKPRNTRKAHTGQGIPTSRTPVPSPVLVPARQRPSVSMGLVGRGGRAHLRQPVRAQVVVVLVVPVRPQPPAPRHRRPLGRRRPVLREALPEGADRRLERRRLRSRGEGGEEGRGKGASGAYGRQEQGAREGGDGGTGGGGPG
jgi:hypothetical protein